MKQIPDITEILDDHRLVKPHLGTQLSHLLLCSYLSENTSGRVTRRQAHDKINNQDNAQNNRNHGKQALSDVF